MQGAAHCWTRFRGMLDWSSLGIFSGLRRELEAPQPCAGLGILRACLC